jgi:ATP-dependent DNA helicase RecG
MTEVELKNLISQKENQTLEFKESTGEKKEICETICAFANSDGGIILIGVKNNGSLSKAKITEKSQTDITDLFVNFKPKITSSISLEIFPNFEGQNILIIMVQKPDSSKNFYKNTCWKRVGASNKDITEEVVNQITNQNHDWSAQICEGVTIEDLEIEIIEQAKESYRAKSIATMELMRESEILINKRKIEIDNLKSLEFLKELGLIDKNNQLKNTAVLLFGNKNAYMLLNRPNATEIFWEYVPSGSGGEYLKFRTPFFKSVNQLVNIIRPKQREYFETIAGQKRVDKRLVRAYGINQLREAIVNCVIHQDYEQDCRIIVLEYLDKIVFQNTGGSLISENDYNNLIEGKRFKIEKYRNKLLADTMEILGMAETKGRGFIKMFEYSTREAYLPSPDPNFNFKNGNGFEYTIYGTEMNPRFAEILIEQGDLESSIVSLLDRIQKFNNPEHDYFKLDKKSKKKLISKEHFQILKNRNLVEGRYPDIYLSAEVAELVGEVDSYLGNKSTEDRSWFKQEIIRFIKVKNKTKIRIERKDIVEYLDKYISPQAKRTEKAKVNFIRRMLNELSADKKIKADGRSWVALE